MDPTRRRPSLAWPLILIGAGVIFLLSNVGILPDDFWSSLLRFWPLLLIILNLDSLYRGEGLFGPLFMIGLGIIFQLSILGYMAWNVWEIILRFWPVLIIILGLDILVGRRRDRPFWAIILGVMAVVFILGGIVWFTEFSSNLQPRDAQTVPVEIPLGSVESADVSISNVGGVLEIKTGAAEDYLVQGSVSLARGETLKQDTDETGNRAVISLKSEGIVVYPAAPWKGPARWDLMLNPSVPISVNTNSVFGESNYFLNGLDLEIFKVSSVFGKSTITTSDEDDFSGELTSVFGEMILMIPEGTPVRITTEGFLSFVDFPETYSKEGQLISSPEADTATNLINIKSSNVFGKLTIISNP